MSAADEPTTAAVAATIDVSTGTLRRWVREGVIPRYDGRWSPAAVSHARLVARLRERGHTLNEIKRAGDEGRLAFAFLQELLPSLGQEHTLKEAAAETGLEPKLIERVMQSMGVPSSALGQISDEDLQFLRYVAAILASGFPLVAFLQLVRVYGQALAQIADAEVRLFHLYVHEPLMRDGVPGLQMAEQMEGLAREVLPLASPMMDHLHHRFLAHFVEQDVIGHMETDLESEVRSDLGRMRVAIAFADLAGYTRLTEEQGDEEALSVVERFVEHVEVTLPDDARVIKTIGDEVMIVGSDAGALIDWAVGFQLLHGERPLPRIGMHFGEVLYRDGDYYGREVNQASRVAARSAGGEVLVTQPIVDAGGPHLDFQHIGEVRLKGFSAPTELFLARARTQD